MLDVYSGNNQIPDPQKITSTKKGNFSRYKDPTGEFTSQSLSLGLWWVGHKVLLYRLLVGGLIILSVALWVFSLISWGIFLLEIPKASQLEEQASKFINYNAVNQRFNPNPIRVISTNLFQDGVNKVDAVSEIENPNEDYYVTFDYVFLISGTTTPPARGLILSQSKTLVAALGIADIVGATGATLQIKNLRWQRISAHDIKDVRAWQRSRINFLISSTTFEASNLTPDLKTNRLAFDIKNESAYGYKRPQFLVGMYVQEVLVGVMPLQTDDFRSQEVKSIDLRNFTSNLVVQNIEVFPMIDIYDSDVYLPPER